MPYEAPGTGANNYVYYVCHYLGGPFTQLPHIKPNEIKEARLVKKFLTGRLDAQVSTYPLFSGEGKEEVEEQEVEEVEVEEQEEQEEEEQEEEEQEEEVAK